MRNNRKRNVFITVLLMVAMCFCSFGMAFAEVTQKDVDAKKKEVKKAAEKAAAATKSMEEAASKLKVLQGEIEATEVQIGETEKKIEKKKKEIQKQNNDLGDRLTAMYKTGTVGYVDVILSSQDITDLVSNLGMVQKILESDQELLKKLQKEHKKLEKLEDQLEDQKSSLEASKATTEELKKKFKKEADEWKAKEDQLQAEAEALAAEAARNAANAEQQILAHGGNIDTSNYAWPTTSSMITSEYGWRICPFHGREFHNGIDIGVRTGQPIYAINDGIITRASWYGGYGNCVILSCGGDISALYGHLSGYNCSTGDYVTRGQVIGYTGSTGNSTGPHLHFTVFLKGGDYSPWNLY